MAEQSTRDSFIVRIYQFDTADKSKVAGLVEAIDGSGTNASFKDTNELGAILSRLVHRPKKAKKLKKDEAVLER